MADSLLPTIPHRNIPQKLKVRMKAVANQDGDDGELNQPTFPLIEHVFLGRRPSLFSLFPSAQDDVGEVIVCPSSHSVASLHNRFAVIVSLSFRRGGCAVRAISSLFLTSLVAF